MTARYDFKLNQGTDLTVPFFLTDESGKALNLSGFSAQMQLRSNSYTGNLVDTLTSENKGIILDGDVGSLTVVFVHEKTEAYPATALVYDIELISPSNLITRVVEGRIAVSPEVTRVSAGD